MSYALNSKAISSINKNIAKINENFESMQKSLNNIVINKWGISILSFLKFESSINNFKKDTFYHEMKLLAKENETKTLIIDTQNKIDEINKIKEKNINASIHSVKIKDSIGPIQAHHHDMLIIEKEEVIRQLEIWETTKSNWEKMKSQLSQFTKNIKPMCIETNLNSMNTGSPELIINHSNSLKNKESSMSGFSTKLSDMTNSFIPSIVIDNKF